MNNCQEIPIYDPLHSAMGNGRVFNRGSSHSLQLHRARLMDAASRLVFTIRRNCKKSRQNVLRKRHPHMIKQVLTSARGIARIRRSRWMHRYIRRLSTPQLQYGTEQEVAKDSQDFALTENWHDFFFFHGEEKLRELRIKGRLGWNKRQKDQGQCRAEQILQRKGTNDHYRRFWF